MSFVCNSKIVDCSCSYIMLTSWNLLPFSANLNFRKRKKKKSHDARYGNWRVQCYGAEINIQCVNFQVIFTSHLPIDVTGWLCTNVVSQNVPVSPLCVSVVEGHPKCSKFLTRYTLCVVLFIVIDSKTVHKYSHPLCRLLHFWTLTTNHSAHCFPTKCSFNVWEVSTAVLPNLKQKMMYTYGPWMSVNPQRSRNCRGHNTKSQCTVTHARTWKSTENDTTTLTPHSRWVVYQVQYWSSVYSIGQSRNFWSHFIHDVTTCNIHSHCLQKLNGTLKYLSSNIITKLQESL